MDNIEKIEALLKKRNGIITTSEVEELGVNSRYLYKCRYNRRYIFYNTSNM